MSISLAGRTLLDGVSWLVGLFFRFFVRSYISQSVSHVVRNQVLTYFLALFSDGFKLRNFVNTVMKLLAL
jgi:hypothetical protein